MTAAQIVVTPLGNATIVMLAGLFFRPRTAADAIEQAGVREVRVVVRGGDYNGHPPMRLESPTSINAKWV